MAVWDSRRYGSDPGWDYERGQPWSVTMQQRQHQAMLAQQLGLADMYPGTTTGATSSAVTQPEPNKKLLLLK